MAQTKAARPAKGRRHYTEADKAKTLSALKANGGNLDRTARETKVPRNTIRLWAKAPDRAAPAEVRQEKDDELEASLTRIATRYAAALDADDTVALILAKNPAALASVLGVAIDKLRLLQGKPTQHLGLFEWLGQAKEPSGA